MDKLLKLAEQIEQAKPEQQREMLELAFNAVFPGPGPGSDDWALWFDIRVKWGRYMNADAFVDAALMFVPRDWCFRGEETSEGERKDNTSVEDLRDWSVHLIPHAITGYANRKKSLGGWLHGEGATFSLAILAASLRAHAAKGDA